MPRVGRGEVVVVETADPSLWVNTLSTGRQGNVLTTVAELVPTTGQAVPSEPLGRASDGVGGWARRGHSRLHGG